MATSRVVRIAEEEFDSEVLGAREPVLVDFTAAWCGPCRALTPILHAIAGESRGEYKVVEIAGDETPLLAARYRIHAFPTVIAFREGREIARHVGLTKKQTFLDMIRSATD